MRDIKSYDSKLFIKKKLDGSVDIVRRSQFEKKWEYVIFTITNQYLGNWIIEKLKSMDTRYVNLFQEIEKKNLAIRNRKSDDRQHRDMADFIRNWEQIII
jgi:hypothetical protein